MTNVSVISAVDPAIQHVKNVLFRPFDLAKWFTLAVSAWLANLGQSGFNFNFTSPGSHRNVNLAQELDRAKEYVLNNLHWIVPVAVVVVLLVMALGVLILWLNCRGQFMFLHCVARNVAEVVDPWRRFKKQANSLFFFRLIIAVAAVLVTLPLIILIGVTIFKMMFSGSVPRFEFIIRLFALGFGLFVLMLPFAVVGAFLSDFVAPIMYLRDIRCVSAWKVFSSVLVSHIGNFVLYLLFRLIVLPIGVFAAIVLVWICTCCIGCCLMMLPFIGTVILLPVLVFYRSYSLCYLQQYGPDYDALWPSTPPVIQS